MTYGQELFSWESFRLSEMLKCDITNSKHEATAVSVISRILTGLSQPGLHKNYLDFQRLCLIQLLC